MKLKDKKYFLCSLQNMKSAEMCNRGKERKVNKKQRQKIVDFGNRSASETKMCTRLQQGNRRCCLHN
jgi:hypothetical protein